MVSNTLILAPQVDPHAQAVCGHLSSMGVSVRFWSLEDLPTKAKLTYTLDKNSSACTLSGSKAEPESDQMQIDFLAFDSVWLRRPGKVKVPSFPEQWVESLVEWECTRAIDAIFRSIPGLWVNPPAKEKEALLKLRQLDIARNCGFSIPESLVTNDPEAVSSFYEKHNGKLIYKLIDEGSYRYFPSYEIVMGMPTLPLRELDLNHLDQVRLSLHLFQRKVEKRSDIRVTVVANKVFAVEILSQEGKGKVDFRLDYSVPMKTHKLPDQTAERCLSVLRELGLTYGAFDLCLDQDGQYIFLEVNPAGQWLWMEKGLDLPISQQIARLLAGLDAPLR